MVFTVGAGVWAIVGVSLEICNDGSSDGRSEGSSEGSSSEMRVEVGECVGTAVTFSDGEVVRIDVSVKLLEAAQVRDALFVGLSLEVALLEGMEVAAFWLVGASVGNGVFGRTNVPVEDGGAVLDFTVGPSVTALEGGSFGESVGFAAGGRSGGSRERSCCKFKTVQSNILSYWKPLR